MSQYTNSLGYSLFTSSGKFYLYEGLSGGWDLTSSTAISAGTWYNVVVTFTPTYMYMYINGALEDSHTRTGTMHFSGSTYTTIGAVDPTRLYWDGVIDDVRIYNRALSTKEIQQLYGQGRTR